MLSRIISDNNENSSYPLIDTNTVYPDNLVTDCCICTRELCEVFLESVVVTDSYVTATLSLSYTSGRLSNVYGSVVKTNGLNIMALNLEKDDSNVGWLWLGSGVATSGVYHDRVPICSSCIKVSAIDDDASMIINGNMYPIGEHINIFVSGDLDVEYTESGVSIYRSELNDTRYDSDDVYKSGGIISINGIETKDGILTISLPKYINVESGKLDDIFTVAKENSTDSVTTLSIKEIYNDNELSSNFTCPDSDILLDKVTTGGTYISGSEAPLDAFIDWYKNR